MESIKISVIIPGTNTNYPDECEVILPRGTVHKVNKVTSGDRAIEQSERREAKVLAVLSFLAVLEMVKKAIVSVEQHNLFDDIVAHPYQEIGQI